MNFEFFIASGVPQFSSFAQAVASKTLRNRVVYSVIWCLQCLRNFADRHSRRPELTPSLVWRSEIQILAAAFTIYLVCLSMILIFGQIRGAYLGGSILTFFLGYSTLFLRMGCFLVLIPFQQC